jgi:ABC-type transport system substrate-binding protein
VDSETATGDEWWRSPNGSGPFRIAEFQAGQLLRLAPFDDFYAGRPYLNEVTVSFGADAAQPFNLYESGAIDLTDLPGYAIDRALSGTDYLGDDLRVVPELSTTFVAVSPDAAPWQDQQLRAALGHIVDRARIVDVGLAGRATAADGLVPNGILGRSWPSDLPAYDPAAARMELDGAGEPAAVPQLFDPGGGSAVLISEVAERELQLAIEVIAPQWPQFVDALAARELPAFALTWIADYPDPASFLTSLFASNSSDNYLNYSNQEVDALLEAAAVEQDEERRATLYLQAQQIIIDEGVLIPLYHGVTYMVVQPEVQGLVVTPIGILALENVWIAS